jgi:predicted nucleotidyltransferase
LRQLRDPNLRLLEAACKSLTPILDEVVLVGGCLIGLLITDPAHPEIRATDDVDLVTEISTQNGYYALSKKLRGLGFHEDGQIICRWRKGNLRVDIMPLEATVLGFTNPWYELAVKTSTTHILSDKLKIRHVTAPLFLATKLASFDDRGQNDFTHHDIEDVVTVINGREELLDEVDQSPAQVKAYLKEEFDALLADTNFTDMLPGHLRPQETERVELVIERMRRLSGQ